MIFRSGSGKMVKFRKSYFLPQFLMPKSQMPSKGDLNQRFCSIFASKSCKIKVIATILSFVSQQSNFASLMYQKKINLSVLRLSNHCCEKPRSTPNDLEARWSKPIYDCKKVILFNFWRKVQARKMMTSLRRY